MDGVWIAVHIYEQLMDAQLRKSIALLRQANLSAEAIADYLGIDIAEIDE